MVAEKVELLSTMLGRNVYIVQERERVVTGMSLGAGGFVYSWKMVWKAFIVDELGRSILGSSENRDKAIQAATASVTKLKSKKGAK